MVTQKLSCQEIFDTVVTGLRKQGCQSISNFGVTTQCYYRGPNGTKCAVGMILPDEIYSPNMEGHAINGLDQFCNFNSLNVPWTKDQIPLLSALQEIHDKDILWWNNLVESSFRDVAKDFNLKYTPVEAKQ